MRWSIRVGDNVVRALDAYRESDKNPIQIGTVVDEKDLRVQVQWPGFPERDQFLNTNRPKRTWIAKTSLSLRA